MNDFRGPTPSGPGDVPSGRPGIGAGRRPSRLPEYLARDLAAYIVERKLPEGTRLPPEKKMRQSLQVGKGTLREALRLLQTRGVITVRPGRKGGPMVRRPRSTDLSEALALVLAFESTTVMDVMNARVALEPVIARLAAQRISRKQLATLQRTIDLMRENAGDHSAFLGQNVRFFATLAQASGNPALKVVNEMLKVVIDGSVEGARFPKEIHHKTAEAHQRIHDALKAKDDGKAEAEVREHLSNASQYWKSKFRTIVDKPVSWNGASRAFTEPS